MPDATSADAYFMPTLRWETWSAHSTDRKNRAINEAASMLSRLSLSSRPPAFAMDNATYEQALCLLEMPPEAQQRVQNIASGLKSFTVGKQSESYQDADKVELLTEGMIICPSALSWLSAYLRPKAAAKSGRLLTGRDCYGARR